MGDTISQVGGITQSPAAWTARILANFPQDWGSPQAMLPGGNFYALILAAGVQFARIVGLLLYAAEAQRFGSETSPELDLAATDYGFRARDLGETDAAYAAAIIASLFLPKATRPVIQAIADQYAAGGTARLIEPWNPDDVGTVDGMYVDADYPLLPCRVGSDFPWFAIIEIAGGTAPDLVDLGNAVQAAKVFGTTIWLAAQPVGN